jgi:hypothetical protein
VNTALHNNRMQVTAGGLKGAGRYEGRAPAAPDAGRSMPRGTA